METLPVEAQRGSFVLKNNNLKDSLIHTLYFSCETLNSLITVAFVHFSTVFMSRGFICALMLPCCKRNSLLRDKDPS